MFNAKRFCEDFMIDIPRTGKNTRRGWINIQCPFCSDESNHGGFNEKGGYYHCFRCGGHWLPKVIAKLTSTTFPKAKNIILQYSKSVPSYLVRKPSPFHYDNLFNHHNKKITLEPLFPLQPHHIEYLKSRNFLNYDRLIRDWKLQSTAHYGEHSHRIFAPIYFENQLVSFQYCRSFDSQKPPYKACAIKDEIIHHKHIVYGFDYAVSIRRCIVVEGITDVWRLGRGAVGTFGKKFTRQQLLLLINNFDEIFIMFDPDTSLGETYQALAGQLSQMGKSVECIRLKNCDPGDLPQHEANLIMQDLKFRR